MKKAKLTRSLLAACSIVALTAVMYGCVHNGDDPPATDDTDMEMGPTAEEQIATLQKEINDLRAQLGLEPDDDLGDSVTALQNEITSLKGELKAKQDDEDETAAKAHRAKLGKLATAIGVPTDEGAATLSDHVRLEAERAKPDSATDGDAPHAISGWDGATWSVTNADDSTTMAAVYNDKASDSPSAFNKRFTIIAAEQTNEGKVALAVADHGMLVDMAGLPTHASHDGVDVGPVNGVRGTLAGAAGTFTSDSGTVLVGISATDGSPTWTGNLFFKPDSATVTVMMPDSTYMSLGWWLTEMENGDLDVHVAAWGSGADYVTTNLGALIGKATFEGIAVGKYTHKTINDINGGHFNADAMLVADWGDATDEGTLRGTISGFMQDGQPLASGWKVELGAAATGDPLAFDPMTGADITVDGEVGNTENGALGTFGTQKTMGTWNAMLVDNTRNDSMPGGVTGTFHVGQTSHPINMVGAFAASNQEADQPDN